MSKSTTTLSITVTLSTSTQYWGVVAGSYAGVVGIDVVGPAQTPTSQHNSVGINAVAQNSGDVILINVMTTPSGVTTSGLASGYNDSESSGYHLAHQAYALSGGLGANYFYETLSTSQYLVTIPISLSPTTTPFVAGQPEFTVSPVGLAAGYTTNNGADYGPDSMSASGEITTTCGIGEAILATAATGGGTVRLLPGTFNTTASILLPVAFGVRLVSWCPNSYVLPVISYSGTGFAIDTNSNPDYSYNAYGFMDGISVTAPSGSGIRLTSIIYDMGHVAINGCAGSGLVLSPGGNGVEPHIANLHINGCGYLSPYATSLVINQDHVTIDHLTTSLAGAGVPVVRWGDLATTNGNIGLVIGYWHHYLGSSDAPNYALDYYESNDECHDGVIIDFLWEGSDLPTTAVFHSTSYGGTNLYVLNLDYYFGQPLTISQLENPANYRGVVLFGLGSVTPIGLIPSGSTPAFGTAQNTFVHPVEVYVTNVGGGITGYAIYDIYGNEIGPFTLTVNVGYHVTLQPGDKITFTFTGSTPQWAWKGL